VKYLIPTLLLCLFLGGCATRELTPVEEAPVYVTISDFTPFFSLGPQQIQGPDASLPANTLFRLLRREMGYSYVMLEDERKGYVPNESIMLAPPDIAAAAASPFSESDLESPSEQASGPRKPRRSSTPAPAPASGPMVVEPLPDFDLGTESLPPLLIDDVEEEEVKPQFRL